MILQALKGLFIAILAGVTFAAYTPAETTIPQSPPCYGIVEPLLDLPHETTGS